MVPSMERVLEESREDLSEGKPKESEERNDRLADGKKYGNDSGGGIIIRVGYVGGYNYFEFIRVDHVRARGCNYSGGWM